MNSNAEPAGAALTPAGRSPEPSSMGRARRTRTRGGVTFASRIAFVAPAIIILVVLTAYPLFQVIQMSLYDYSKPKAPVFAGLSGFAEVFANPAFWNALKNTLHLTLASSAISLILSIVAALALNRPMGERARAFFRSVYMIPWLFSSAVVAAIWSMMLSPFGLINHLLGLAGLEDLSKTEWLSSPSLAMWSVIAASVWRSLPFWILMIFAGLQSVPTDLHEAARVDGANYLMRVFHIDLVHLRPIILTVVTLETIWSFRSFDLVYMMTGGGPIDRTELLSTFVYGAAFRRGDFGTAATGALFMLAVMLLASAFYIRSVIVKQRGQ